MTQGGFFNQPKEIRNKTFKFTLKNDPNLMTMPTLYIARLKPYKLQDTVGVLLQMRECSEASTRALHLELAKSMKFAHERHNLKLMRTPPRQEIPASAFKIIFSDNKLKTPPPTKKGGSNPNVSAFTPYIPYTEEQARSLVSPTPSKPSIF